LSIYIRECMQYACLCTSAHAYLNLSMNEGETNIAIIYDGECGCARMLLSV